MEADSLLEGPSWDGQVLEVECRGPGGELLATLSLEPSASAADLARSLAEALATPFFQAILPDGELLRNIGDAESLRCHLGLPELLEALPAKPKKGICIQKGPF